MICVARKFSLADWMMPKPLERHPNSASDVMPTKTTATMTSTNVKARSVWQWFPLCLSVPIFIFLDGTVAQTEIVTIGASQYSLPGENSEHAPGVPPVLKPPNSGNTVEIQGKAQLYVPGLFCDSFFDKCVY